MNGFTDWHLECWYKIKPLALRLFNDCDYDSHWIKNAWLFLLDGAPEDLQGKLVPKTSGATVEAGMWLLALYELLWEFKTALDCSGIDRDRASWAESLGILHDEKYIDSDEMSEVLEKLRDVFTILIRKRLKSTQDIFSFMCNELNLMSQEEFIVLYCHQNEYVIRDVEDFQRIEERYEDYCFERRLHLPEQWKVFAGYEWVERVFQVYPDRRILQG